MYALSFSAGLYDDIYAGLVFFRNDIDIRGRFTFDALSVFTDIECSVGHLMQIRNLGQQFFIYRIQQLLSLPCCNSACTCNPNRAG